MATIPSSPTWSDDVYQIETTDAVLGGPDGAINVQAKQLADRTDYLKQQTELAGATADQAETKADQALAQIDSIEIASGAASESAMQALVHKQAAEAARALAEQARNAAQAAQAQASDNAGFAYQAAQTSLLKSIDAQASSTAAISASSAAAGARDAALQAKVDTQAIRDGAVAEVEAAAADGVDQIAAERDAAIAITEAKKAEIVTLAAGSMVDITAARDATVAAKVVAEAKAAEATLGASTATAQAGTATAQASAAASAKTAAEAARDAAQLSAGVYATTAAGLAATTSGRYFSVPSADSAEYLILYLNNAGAAVEVKRYPSVVKIDKIFMNDGNVVYLGDAFINATGIGADGVEASSTTAKTTNQIKVKAGWKVKVTSYSNSALRPFILVYDANRVFVRAVAPATYSAITSVETTVEADGFIRAQWASNLTALPANGKVSINEGKPLYLDPYNIGSDATLIARSNTKADKSVSETLDMSFKQGGVNSVGTLYDSSNEIRSKLFKLIPGTVIRMLTTSSWMFAYNTSDTSTVSLGAGAYQASRDMTITITEDRPYFRMMFRKQLSGTVTVPADAVNLTVTATYGAAYLKDFATYAKTAALESLGTSIENLKASVETRFVPTYKTPSQATGGIVSFIDDDGKLELYTQLYSFMKARSAPFGAAIVPAWVDTANHITSAQLKEMHADVRFFEVMNHGFQHLNMTGLTAEQQHYAVMEAKQWFSENGFETEGFVLPYGGDTPETLRIVSQYYPACYDYAGGATGLQSFSTIRNMKIIRFAFDQNMDNLRQHVATAAATGQWLVICTHVLGYDWTPDSWTHLDELITLVKNSGCKIMLPSEAFHVYGNLLESDNGFRITANGTTIPGSA